MSASTTPTDSPRLASAAARLTVTLRLADAALARRDRVDAGQRAGLGERDDRLGGVGAAHGLAQLGALLVAHHVELDLHRGDPGDGGHGGGDAGW